ncbi:MAG TPA: CoA transferase [Acidisphaera sp.]|nr:CoA transferase [Acidisphaera sp.]
MSRLNSFLDGLRVVDVSAYLPGPLASLLLSDMGADVVKVEPPQGDGMRLLGPRDAAGKPLFHAALNAGKTVRHIDLKSPDGRAVFLDLLDTADVLIEGFRPGVMERLGLGYETLHARNPGLIFCSISGYGAAGPLAQAAGHDNNYLALAGVLHRNGVPPRAFDPPFADMTSSLFAAIAILGAVHGRRQDGLGCHIDLAIGDVAMPLQLFEIAALGATGRVPQPEGTYLNGGAAYYRVYGTADGRHVALGAVEEKFWRSFCEAARRPDWINRQAEPIPQHALIAELTTFFATLTVGECERRFAEADCCLTPVLDLGEAVQTPHHRARGVVRPGPHGGLQALFPALVDGESPAVRADFR